MAGFTRNMVLGLQGSGKTTFAAALWYILANGGVSTVLERGLHSGDYSYLDRIAELWERGYKVPRTEHFEHQKIEINLLEPLSQKAITLEFTDLPGEGFERAFASRRLADVIAQGLQDLDGLLVFVNAAAGADNVPIMRIAEQTSRDGDEDFDVDDDDSESTEKASGAPNGSGISVPFDPSQTPRDVQLVDILQSLQERPASGRFPRIAVIISAWDKIRTDAGDPPKWFSARMPLLSQYLKNTGIPFQIYGVSAQGGDVPKDAKAPSELDRQKLLSFSNAGERVRVVGYGADEHDLTHPVRWLSGLEPE